MLFSDASTGRQSGQVLSIDTIPSGLNNQRIALLGLLDRANRAGARVKLPELLLDFTPRPRIERRKAPDEPIPLKDVFDEESLKGLLARYSLDTRQAATEFMPAHDAFAVGTMAVRRLKGLSEPDENNLTCSFLRDVTPAAEIRAISAALADEVLVRGSVGLQLRIERDWQEYLAKKNAKLMTDHEEIPISADRIFEKVAASALVENGAALLICCDEDDLLVSKQYIKEVAVRFGLQAYFKSELTAFSMFPGSRLMKAMIEFNACLQLQNYIGLTRSTFSNMLSAISWCQGRSTRHFIYNGPGSSVEIRHDRGLAVSPIEATRFHIAR